MLDDLSSYLPAAIIMFFLVRRTQRSRRLRPGLMWITPVLLLAFGALFTFGAVRKGPPVSMTDALIIAGAALAGVALGAVRGNTVHLTRHAETGNIESKLSMWGLAVIVVWMIGRNVLHHFGLQDATTPFGVFNDAMIMLAIVSVTTRAIILFRRCAVLEALPATSKANDESKSMTPSATP